MLRASPREIGLQCMLYTATMRYSGDAMANYLFLLDAMNSTNRAFVEMHDLYVEAIVNTDQGTQFTAQAWTSRLQSAIYSRRRKR